MLTIRKLDRPKTHCRRCKVALLRGELYANQDYFDGEDPEWAVPDWYHPMCAVDVYPEQMHDCLKREKTEFTDRKAVAELAQKRAAAIAKAEAMRSSRTAKNPATVIEIEQARDPFGRPRCSVYFAGSLASDNVSSLDGGFSLFSSDYTICSPLREYVLKPQSGALSLLGIDPSQPIVGAVFAHYADVRIMGSQRDKVVQWKAMNVPTPVLWVHQRKSMSPAALDACVLALRAMLETTGYNGDDALVVHTKKETTAEMALVALKLDEALSGAKVQTEKALEGTAVEHLESLLKRRNTDAYLPALEMIASHLTGIIKEDRERCASAVAQCLSHAPARGRALMLLKRLKCAPRLPEVREALSTILESATTGRQYAKEFDLAVALLTNWRDQDRFAILWRAYQQPKLTPTRRAQLQPHLAKCASAALAADIERWVGLLRAKDPRRPLGEKLQQSVSKKAHKLAVSAHTA
jgi:hypothetical protein